MTPQQSSSTTVPTYTSSALDQIYPSSALATQRSRWRDLCEKFKDLYGRPPDHVARSPGRVNIIGEHIDYSLYEVLPMAITADTLVAIAVVEQSSTTNADKDESRSASSRVKIANVVENRFPAREFDLPLQQNSRPDESGSLGENGDGDDDSDNVMSIDASAHDWTNYFKAGINGAARLIARRKRAGTCGSEEGSGKTKVLGSLSMNVLVDGQVPTGAGLSSSAALVCASSLAVLRACGLEDVDKTELVMLAIVAERAVGVNAGGMDQAASVLSENGSALYVSFVPRLHGRPVGIPKTNPETVFLAAQSFVQADKQATAPIHYNLRVVECSLAADFLAKIFRLKRPLKPDSSPLAISLRSFHDAYFCEKEGVADNNMNTTIEDFRAQLDKLVRMTDDYLIQEEGYALEEISQILGQSEDDIREKYMTKVPVRAERFMLRQRALHVFSEARRVIDFMTLLSSPPGLGGKGEKGEKDKKDHDDDHDDNDDDNNDDGNNSLNHSAYLGRLGALMNETQDSCRDVYDCSAPELDELCRLALGAGAYGSRLTGAGWGGCSVHLVAADKVKAVMESWKEAYYRKKFPEMAKKTDLDLEEEGAVVVSRPGSGSCVVVFGGDGDGDGSEGLTE